MKRRSRRTLLASVLAAAGLAVTTTAASAGSSRALPVRRCAADAVVAGTVCIDRYEASVWRVPNATTTNAMLASRIRLGRATAADLRAGGAIQLGVSGDDYAPCADDGGGCADDIFALSLPAQIPSADITWFQALEACANARKRLPTNAEWQVAADGTIDPTADNGTTDCNSTGGAASPTGSRSACLSARGAYDMVGNLDEWVADWVPLSSSCPGWGGFSNDFMCLAGTNAAGTGPGALLRGGHFFGGRLAGPLTVSGTFVPSRSEDFVGFRCAR